MHNAATSDARRPSSDRQSPTAKSLSPDGFLRSKDLSTRSFSSLRRILVGGLTGVGAGLGTTLDNG